MGKTKVDSCDWKTRVTSVVSLIAAGTLECRKIAVKGMEENTQERGKAKFAFFIVVFGLGFFFFHLHLHQMYAISIGATQTMKATATISKQYLLILF